MDLHKSHSLVPRAWAVLRLIHPFPASTVVVTSGVLLIVAHRGIPSTGFLVRALAAVATTQVPVGALNEYVDRDRDAATQPGKPIPAHLVSAKTALVLVTCGLLALLALAGSFGAASLGLLLLGTAGGLAYDLWLKPTPFSVVAYMIGFLSLLTWIWLVAGHLTAAFVLVYPAGALALLAAHLAQSYPDVESDRELGQRGLAAGLGPAWTWRLVAGPYALLLTGGTALALLAQSWAAGAALAAAGVLGAAAMLECGRPPHAPAKRELLFRLVAPGLGLLATGGLIGLQAVT